MRRLLAVLVALTVSPACSADWPQWLGPSRDNRTTEVVAPWTEPPRAAWRHPAGNGFSVPVVAGGLVFVHAAVPDRDEEVVTAFDLVTGAERWKDVYPRPVYRSQLGVGPRATPVVSGGKLFTIGINGLLTCYDAPTGRREWQADVYGTLKAPLPGFGVCTSPVVVGNRLILPVGGAGSAVVAFDTADGTIAWRCLDEPAGSASPVMMSVADGSSGLPDVVVQTTLRVVGLNPLDGTVRWEHPLVFEPSGVSPTPLVAGDLVVPSTQDTGTIAVRIVRDGSPPQAAWERSDLGGYFSTGVAIKDRVMVVTNALIPIPRADVTCLDAATGREVWQKSGLGYFHVGLAATGDGRLLILDDAGNLILADFSGEEYKELCRAKACGGTFVAPALADGRVVVRDDREVVCYPLTSDR